MSLSNLVAHYYYLGNHLKPAVLLGDRLQRPLEGGEIVSVLRVGQDGMGEGNSLQFKKIGNVLYFRKKNIYVPAASSPAPGCCRRRASGGSC